MDFSCDRCGRRYFVPDELVQGRAFRAKCDDCNHAFVVAVPDTLGAPFEPQAPATPAPEGQALSDADLAEIEEELGPLLPEWKEPTEAPSAGLTSWPEAAEEPLLPPPAFDWPLPVEEAPLPPPVLPNWPEPDVSAPLASPAVAARPADEGARPVAIAPRAQPVHPAPQAAKVEVPDVARREPTAGRAAAAPKRVPAGVPRREPKPDSSGPSEEDIIAAGTRHRYRAGIVAGAVVLGACALGALLFTRIGRSGAQAPRAPAASAGAAAAPGTAPFDASALAFRGGSRASPPRGGATAKGTSTRKRRRVAVRLEDRKLFDLLGRKDDVAMQAPPKDDVELDSAKDALDPVAVERTVAASRRAFDACVTKAMRLNPNLRVAKRATLIVTVEPNGKVTGGWIAEEQIEGTDLGRCLVTASSRMSFPTFEGEAIDVSIPLSLSAIQ